MAAAMSFGFWFKLIDVNSAAVRCLQYYFGSLLFITCYYAQAIRRLLWDVTP